MLWGGGGYRGWVAWLTFTVSDCTPTLHIQFNHNTNWLFPHSNRLPPWSRWAGLANWCKVPLIMINDCAWSLQSIALRLPLSSQWHFSFFFLSLQNRTHQITLNALGRWVPFKLISGAWSDFSESLFISTYLQATQPLRILCPLFQHRN